MIKTLLPECCQNEAGLQSFFRLLVFSLFTNNIGILHVAPYQHNRTAVQQFSCKKENVKNGFNSTDISPSFRNAAQLETCQTHVVSLRTMPSDGV